MSHECEDCGATFETVSGLRLHGCSDADPGVASGDTDADLDAPVEQAESGDVPALHRTVAIYESELSAALDRNDGGRAYRDLFWEHFEPLANGLDAAVRERGWSVLAEFVDAYDPATGDDGVPLASPVVENAVGRFVVRTRLQAGVDAVPATALAYLHSIAQYAETDVPREESFAYGWGIGHPEHDVAGHVVEMAVDDYFWASAALERSFFADQHAAVDLLERLVTDDGVEFTVSHPQGDVGSARLFLNAVAGPEYGPSEAFPRYWDWQKEVEYSFEWDDAVEQRIRTLADETGVVADLPAEWTFRDLGL